MHTKKKKEKDEQKLRIHVYRGHLVSEMMRGLNHSWRQTEHPDQEVADDARLLYSSVILTSHAVGATDGVVAVALGQDDPVAFLK